MIRLFLLLFILLNTCFQSGATHIVGGELFYDCLGNNSYRITLKVYRECGPANSNQTPFDNPAPIAIYEGGVLVQNLSVTLGGVVNVPVLINDPCLSSPPNICVEQGTYITTINLPTSAIGYDIVYQRCCHNPNIMNILAPGDMGSTFWAKIPPAATATCNSSPRFNALPPLVMCNGSAFSFDHSATDPDGDQLQYVFYTPFHGGDAFAPAPNPAFPPPYTTINWAGGFSLGNQIQGAPAFNLNAGTGLLTGTPITNGIHLYGVKVIERRNGQIISEIFREFQITVTNCPSLVVSAIPVQTELCQGMTLNIGNNSQNSSFYHWDFGVPGITNDTSNQVAPTYTYPDTGTFTITLIANPGVWCADTATQTYEVHLPLNLSLATPAPQCEDVNSFDFDLNGNFTNAANIQWTFGPFANPSTSAVADPQNVVYSDSGHYNASVIVTQFGCTETVDVDLVVFPLPEFGFTYPPDDGCAPFPVFFTNTSYAWGTIAHQWNFGDGNFSNEANPFHLYPNPGSFDLTVTISVDSICVKTETFVIPDAIVVHPSPTASVSATPPSASIWFANFTAFDNASGHVSQTIFFDNGYSFTDTSEATVNFVTSGEHSIWQIAVNEFGCTDTSYTTIFVEGMTTVFAPNAFSPNGDGKNEIWMPHVYDVTNYRLLIYDRWGQPIFETEQTNTGWDGTRKGGKLCPQDVYVYLIIFRDWSGMDREIRGHFSLIR
ncbi:MAG TPA: PKD domain-containing protein [Flavobacteriales bacterium]|nr:PKD domain-containing protein [Flavobacteriales bacterium]HRJ39017.1 PKD domain-containing protein [Flavobacteriales bacterium]